MWPNYTKNIPLAVLTVLLAGCAGQVVKQGDVQSQALPAELLAAPPAVQRDYQAALEQMAQQNDTAAASQFEEFVARHPGYPGAYINLAIIYDGQNRTEEALGLLDQALAADPGSVYALNRLALIKRRQGQFSAAEAAWLRATQADPQYAYAWYNLGVLYDLYLQDLPAALDYYKRYQQLSDAADQDLMVSRWIEDLERRIGTPAQAAQARELL
jgi:tetratricopeptide (TPR) repeat protein